MENPDVLIAYIESNPPLNYLAPVVQLDSLTIWSGQVQVGVALGAGALLAN